MTVSGLPEVRRLVAELRSLREASGLSLSELAARTPYSRSSWARYLKGEQLAPRDAVLALCQVAQQRPDRLLALWELADTTWSGRVGSGPDGPPPVGSEPAEAEQRTVRHGYRRRWSAVLAGVGVVVAAGTGALLVSERPWDDTARPPAFSPGCSGLDCDGRDPLEMGCGVQHLVTSSAVRTFADGRRVEIRYNETCRAVWARALRLRLGDQVELTRPGTRPKIVRATDEAHTLGYLSTPMTMADRPDGARVCVASITDERFCFSP
ncbi:helix-turn-helix domain-containing protein [Streptomyces pacificus]|uniref:XRE family transcriptional regulator n=1 Tax=Streptomyces pacificus TaxID=2705029 RepID=A0A6A0B2B2_9ACTN|nr:XRE family transcriptional regulator [Streptomyces pacificus]GFH37917.1 XRE family transcriptional regulator [Streptomyces pacificus]